MSTTTELARRVTAAHEPRAMSNEDLDIDPFVSDEAELSSASIDLTDVRSEALAKLVIEGCRQFKGLIPYVVELRRRFQNSPRGKADIAGCRTWTEFCEKKLDRTDRAVRKAITAYEERSTVKNVEPLEQALQSRTIAVAPGEDHDAQPWLKSAIQEQREIIAEKLGVSWRRIFVVGHNEKENTISVQLSITLPWNDRSGPRKKEEQAIQQAEPSPAISSGPNQWQEKTWNVVVGCSRVSAGCDNCYAINEAQRLAGNPKMLRDGTNPYTELIQIRNGKPDFSGKLHFFEDRLDRPARARKPTIWFVNSLSDLYHREVSLDTLKRIFDVMNRADRHIFNILTKRHDRMTELSNHVVWTPNIWQGVTFEGVPDGMPEGQRSAVLSRIPALQQHPAHTKFISFEPLIGPIPPDLDLTGIDWAFFGGESHPVIAQARPMDLAWLRDGIALCETHGCKPHVKQLGTAWAAASGNWPPPAGTVRSDYGRWRMGKPGTGWPEDLQALAIESLRQVTPQQLEAYRAEAKGKAA